MLLQATLALSLVVSSLKSVRCDFYIFRSDAPIACPPFNLVQNSVVHSPPSVIGQKVERNERTSCGMVIADASTTMATVAMETELFAKPVESFSVLSSQRRQDVFLHSFFWRRL